MPAMPVIGFDYRISRTYPYQWFPWVTIVGGLIATVLISVFSMATNGYYLESVFAVDRNGTMSRDYWFNKAPLSWTEHISATCQSAQLQVGTTFYTDKFWNQFTVIDVKLWDGQGWNIPAPVIMYSQNELYLCAVDVISMYLHDTTQIPYQHFSPIASPLEIEAAISCILPTDPPTGIVLSAKAGNLVSGLFASVSQLADPTAAISSQKSNPEGANLPSRMLAEFSSILYTISLVSQLETNPPPGLLPGNYVLERDFTNSDITSPGFFTTQTYNYSKSATAPPELQVSMNLNFTLPTAMDRIVKLWYSSLMVDLGFPNRTIFANEAQLLDWADTAVSSVQNGVAGAPTYKYSMQKVINATEAWRVSSKAITPDTLNKSTIYTQYQCSVPRLKSTGALIMSVFLADLVFLRAMWWLFNWGTTWWLERSDPTAMYCRGCLADERVADLQRGDEFMGLERRTRSSSDIGDDEKKRIYSQEMSPTEKPVVRTSTGFSSRRFSL